MSSKHVIKDIKGASHISSIEEKVGIPLDVLRDGTQLTRAELESRSLTYWEVSK